MDCSVHRNVHAWRCAYRWVVHHLQDAKVGGTSAAAYLQRVGLPAVGNACPRSTLNAIVKGLQDKHDGVCRAPGNAELNVQVAA